MFMVESTKLQMLGLYVDVRRRIPGRRSTLLTKEARMERRRAIVDQELRRLENPRRHQAYPWNLDTTIRC